MDQQSPLDYQSLIPSLSQFGTFSDPAGFSANIVALLLFIFLLGAAFAIRAFAQSLQKVREINGILEGASRDTLGVQRREIRERAQNETLSGNLWREFDESLVLVEKTNRLYNTIDAQHFFNTHSLARGLTENRLLAAMPGILTAIGVIGTFAGLQLGLSALGSSLSTEGEAGVEELKNLTNGIFTMIAGASIAFTTSLWGVLLSVLFNFGEKALERNVRGRISTLQNQIDFLFPRVTAEQSLVNIEESSKSSQEKLAELDEKIGHRLQVAMSQATDTIREGITDSLERVLGPAIEKLVTNATTGSEKAFEALLKEFMGKMGAAGEEQRRAAETTTSGMKAASDQITADMSRLSEKMDTLLNAHERLTTDFTELTQANREAAQQLQGAATSMDAATRRSEASAASFETASASLASAVSEASAQISTSATQLDQINTAHQGALARLEGIFGILGDLQAKLDNISGDAGEGLTAATAQLGQIANLMKSQMQEFEERLANLGNTQIETHKQALEDMGAASAKVIGRVEDLLKRVDETLTQTADGADSFLQVANANQAAAHELMKVSETLGRSAAGLAQHEGALARSSEQLLEATRSSAAKVQEAASVLETVAKSHDRAEARIEELAEQITSISAQLQRAGEMADSGLSKVNAHFDHVAESMRDHIEELEKQTAKLLQEFAEEVQTQTQDRMNDWNKHTNEYISAMSSAVQAISSVVDDIEGTLSRNRGR
jgi:DNA repair exonuclease SbcCD ATPase subunit